MLYFLPSSAWIKVEQLKPYHPHKEEMIKINKGKRFQQAVDAVEEYLKKAKGKEQVSSSALDTWGPRLLTSFICKDVCRSCSARESIRF